jgi:hypothetical protein
LTTAPWALDLRDRVYEITGGYSVSGAVPRDHRLLYTHQPPRTSAERKPGPTNGEAWRGPATVDPAAAGPTLKILRPPPTGNFGGWPVKVLCVLLGCPVCFRLRCHVWNRG